MSSTAVLDGRTRLMARELGFNPAASPKEKRVHSWAYDMGAYEGRNEAERFLRPLKGFRGICARYDKLNRMVTAFIFPSCICISLLWLNTPEGSAGLFIKGGAVSMPRSAYRGIPVAPPCLQPRSRGFRHPPIRPPHVIRVALSRREPAL
jgi:hypothetical protein